ncbi:nicotinate-nucleotide adenylyltransferase [Thalassotalea sediminis]|uniref:nicotinate-nucleotide adenylyltransferase n=1 Tax=Thalassotalea sediminis TaxID=1759089 RepID=UPI0025747A4E|nr:nicotinate-nucleotide adenylyltransferase [Thalassotalea sediminis]
MSTYTPNKYGKRIGILGGTFDPIHNGHIYPAIKCIEYLSLAQLHLMPAHIPPHKQGTVASAEHRKNMVSLACNVHEKLILNDRELKRNTPSYTVDTLAEIKQHHPDWQLYFIVGMDSLLTFTSWYQWQSILKYCHLVVTLRPGYHRDTLSNENLATLTPYFAKQQDELFTIRAGLIAFIQQEVLDISSTQIRETLAQNKITTLDMPSNVLDYIQQHNLYR